MTHDAEIHTLAAPYALHALPVGEVELFEQHLDECGACRIEVDEIRETAARLGWATEVVPPAALKERVMARIATVRPLPPLVDELDDDADDAAVGDGGVVAPISPWRQWWPRVALGAAAAMAAVAVFLGAQLAGVRDDLAASQAIGAQMSELVAAPDFEVVRATESGSSGTVVMARSLDTAVVLADGMEPAPDDHTYQLWYVEGGTMRSAGLLGTTDEGRLGPFTASGLDTASALGITVEPAGGSEQPTTDPVMLIDLPA